MPESSPAHRRARVQPPRFSARLRTAWCEGMQQREGIRRELLTGRKHATLAVFHLCGPLHMIVHSARALYLAGLKVHSQRIR